MTIEKQKERIESLRKIAANWDGRGALPMSQDNYNDALIFINKCKLKKYGIYMSAEGLVEMAYFENPCPDDLTIEIHAGTYRVLDDKYEAEFKNIHELIDFMNTFKEESTMSQNNYTYENVLEKMKNTEQMQGLSVYEHGLSVRKAYQNLVQSLEKNEEVIDPIVKELYKLLKDKIYKEELVYRYQEFHDCGKPFCLTIDSDGKRHFPDHAKVSAQIWMGVFPDENKIAELIEHDMDFHILKGEELDKIWLEDYAPTLYFTAWAEIIANSQMFGGFESTSFKIKKKKLIQAGKRFKNIK